MKLPVYCYGHPVLREVSKPVEQPFEGLKELVDLMFEAMYESEGVGLAAPQIGKNIKLVVLDGDAISRSEGCLSLPGISEKVPRVEHIRLRWLDEDFKPHEEEISGFLARIVQHECDHLDGRVFIDHISGIRKQLIKRKLSDIVAGKVRVDYPVRFAPRKK